MSYSRNFRRPTIAALWGAAACLTLASNSSVAQEAEQPDQAAPDQEPTLGEMVKIGLAETDIEEALRPIYESIMEPGPKVEGWSKGGIDVIALLTKSEAGLEGSALTDGNDFVPSVVFFGNPDRSIGEQYNSELIQSDPLNGDTMTALVRISPGVLLTATSTYSVKGNAICSGQIDRMSIHSSHTMPRMTAGEFGGLLAFVSAATISASYQFCQVYHLSDDGSIITKSFLPDGRALPKLDAESYPFQLQKWAEVQPRLDTDFVGSIGSAFSDDNEDIVTE